jgi:hypothetical protein
MVFFGISRLQARAIIINNTGGKANFGGVFPRKSPNVYC